MRKLNTTYRHQFFTWLSKHTAGSSMGKHYHWLILSLIRPLIHSFSKYLLRLSTCSVPEPKLHETVSALKQPPAQWGRQNHKWIITVPGGKGSDTDCTRGWETQGRDLLVVELGGGSGKASPREWHLSPVLKAEKQIVSGWGSLFLASMASAGHTQQVLPYYGLSNEECPSVGEKSMQGAPELNSSTSNPASIIFHDSSQYAPAQQDSLVYSLHLGSLVPALPPLHTDIPPQPELPLLLHPHRLDHPSRPPFPPKLPRVYLSKISHLFFCFNKCVYLVFPTRLEAPEGRDNLLLFFIRRQCSREQRFSNITHIRITWKSH